MHLTFLCESHNNRLVITKGYGVRVTTIERQKLLLQHCALCEFHVADGQNMRDPIQSDLCECHVNFIPSL